MEGGEGSDGKSHKKEGAFEWNRGGQGP